MWGIGVARVNAYKIYEAMWDEERAKGRMDLPAKWTAGEFIEQLAYDMMFPAQTLVHRQLLRREEDLDTLASKDALSLHLGVWNYNRRMRGSGTSAARRGSKII